MNKPVVSVGIITYNQAPYIRQAVDGILMQKTDFGMELVIGEDFSTDNTRAICTEYSEKYPHLIKLLPSRANIGAMSNFIRTLEACTGRYIAFCEGDDYWTDSYKLQKQVDFLEKNEDYGLVHSDFDLFYEIHKRRVLSENKRKNIPVGEVFEKLVLINFIATLTVCTRSDLLLAALHVLKNHAYWIMGDYPLWLELSKNSKVGYINQPTAVRRLLPESASQSKDTDKVIRFLTCEFEIRKYFIDNNKPKLDIICEANNQNNKVVLEKAFKDHNAGLLSLYNHSDQERMPLVDKLYHWGLRNILVWLFLKVILKIFPYLRISPVKILEDGS